MRPTQHRWWILVAGVMLAWATMLSIKHVPGLRTPEIAENRVLATRPAAPEASTEGLRTFREGMDAYVNDNFPARTHFIAGINLVRYKLGYSGTARVAVGRDGWLFYDDGSHLGQLRAATPLTDQEISVWLDTHEERARYIEQLGIPYLMVSAPLQERIYPEKAPLWAQPTGGGADADVLQAAAQARGLDNFLNLYPVLLAQKKKYPDAYSPFDTHWTGHGAHGAYVALLEAMQRRGVAVSPRPLSSFTPLVKPTLQQPQILAVMLGLASFVTQDFPQYTDPAVEARMTVEFLTERKDWAGTRVIDTGVEGAPVLLITGDSFSSELFPFLYPHFSRLVISHYDEGFFRPDLAERFKPDVVVLEVLESGLRHSIGSAPVPGAASVPAGSVPAPVSPRVGLGTGQRVLGDGSEALPGYRCNLEQASHSVDGGGLGQLEVAGWMADVDGGRVGTSAQLLLQSATHHYRAPLVIELERTDVADYFNLPGIVRSGFRATLAAPADPGVYVAYLRQETDAGGTVCQTHVSITIP